MGTSLRALGAAFTTATLMGVALCTPAAARALPHRAGTVGGDQLAGRGLISPEGVKAPPKTTASSYVIADAETGQVLAAKDPHGHYLPASTLKTLTAVTLIPKLDKGKTVKPSQDACNEEGSAVGLVPKPIYKVDDLMRALLMVSGNDAANALAEAHGGMTATLADMNKEARRLQAYDTVAKTPSGLDRPGQRSSAYDLALIARAGLALPSFRKYVSTKTAKFPAPKGYYEIGNHNKLLWRYPGMIGVKNGWTSKALGSFVGAASRNGHTIIVSIMHDEGSFWEDVAKMLDWGFAARGRATPVGVLVDPVPEKASVVPELTGPARSGSALAGGATALPSRRPVAAVDSGSGPIAAMIAIGAGLLGGLIWLGYGIRRRRAGRT
ncbi:D-alanyl-D-alanine carboxypeptidase family protein [Microtetraspora sp. AC03309]|uniref:D-alanyl-D-alanine carboxypeptidase family protein n=1 Tax=Microtetraspora sp. AC03309 TaxID=2779376 RepID=UPI001E4B330F|nr:serine hydrolase [Microtetraspora sp. AC03309]